MRLNKFNYKFKEEQLIQKRIKLEYLRLHPELNVKQPGFCMRNYQRFIAPIFHIFSFNFQK